MKKLFVFLCVSCLVFLSSTNLMAGGVDNRSNLSGEYMRTLNRNATTDSLDAIAYNPAGVMAMEDGNYGDFSIQYVMKDYTNVVDGIALEQDTPSLIPALFALVKHDKWAGFFAFTIPAGGGEVEYGSGSATTKIASRTLINLVGSPAYVTSANERLEAESVYYGFTVGGAYKFNDVISISLAGRYIDANKEARITFQLPSTLAPTSTTLLDYEEEADGFGFILGLHLDYDSLNIGMKYEMETGLDFKYQVNQDYITVLPVPITLGQAKGILFSGMEHARNLPAVFAIGAGYKITPELRLDVNLTYYFQEDADWGGDENYVDNGWEAGVAVEYAVNSNMKLSAGYLHSDTGMPAMYATNEAPELNADSFAAGMAYQVNNNLKIEGGIVITKYENDSYIDLSSGQPITVGLEKDVMMLSAAVQYRF